jgi:hypothetical protein
VALSRVEKCPAKAVTKSTTGCGSVTSFAKCKSEAKGVDRAVSSRTDVTSPPTVTSSMPNGGRSWINRARPIISYPAAIRRANWLSVHLSGISPKVHVARPASARAGAVRSLCF